MDRGELLDALKDLRVALDDMDAIAVDMMRPPSERELGPALHRSHYAEAHRKALATLDHITKIATP